MTGQKVVFRRDLLGVDHPVGTYKVTREAILEFCKVVGEQNPLHTDEEAARRKGFRSLVAPPTLPLIYHPYRSLPDIALDFPGVMTNGGQSIEVLKPVQAGDSLEVKVCLKDVYTKTGRSGTMVFVVWEATYTNQVGVIVAVGRQNSIGMLRSD